MYHIMAAMVAVLGMAASVYALLGERYKWSSFVGFSVATKVPVEIFFVSGPIVMVTFLLYAVLAFLLSTERATSTVFYISASWAMIFIDMSLVLYDDWRDIFRKYVDTCLHTVNIYIAVYALINMPYTPTTFILITQACWGTLVMTRVVRRFMDGQRARLPSMELERTPFREVAE